MDASAKMMLCATPPVHVQVTVAPGRIVVQSGLKKLSPMTMAVEVELQVLPPPPPPPPPGPPVRSAGVSPPPQPARTRRDRAKGARVIRMQISRSEIAQN